MEPGFFGSELAAAKQSPALTVSGYDTASGRVMAAFEAAITHGPTSALIAAPIARVIAERAPRLHYRIGREAVAVPTMATLLPQSLFERGLRHRFRLDS